MVARDQENENETQEGFEPEDIDMMVPTDWSSKLRGCLSCSLVKTVNQFATNGCENCPFLNMQGDKERIMDCTSNSILGIYTTMNPRTSWVARWQRTVKLRPGCYAIAIDATLPEGIEEELSEQGIRVKRTRATAEATLRK
uniref:Spt4/RpoE2 zinc finger domain-containing protein n=1 Tax=Rhodosorus marinus TaxID=101924 RepID=A0A7S0BQA9_9RHOD|mmetsp:Transcript_4288/g.6078  ORF Transcript_4288/g.6078 Transcript_4288/m.6078 type:complete len:141 (+) Transcript_4288:103-525(+)